MICQECGESVAPGARACVACECDVGFPNVRAANDSKETEELYSRLNAAVVSTKARNCYSQLSSLGTAVLSSKAVICRSLPQVRQLLENQNSCFTTFYQQIHSGGRIPEGNSWDQGRTSVDALLFPHYHDKIRIAALSLNNRGLFGNYGGVCIVLKEPMIVKRATVFDENPFSFCKRHRVVAGTEIPVGYRASWENRDKLAMAKLHSQLSPLSKSSDFPDILLRDTGDPEKDEFIEVHIFGSFNRSAVELVTFPKPKKRQEIQLYRSFKIKLNKLKIPFEEFLDQ